VKKLILNLILNFLVLTLPGLGLFKNLKTGERGGELVGSWVISPEWDMLET